jgi:hypothetical protein
VGHRASDPVCDDAAVYRGGGEGVKRYGQGPGRGGLRRAGGGPRLRVGAEREREREREKEEDRGWSEGVGLDRARGSQLAGPS